MSVVGVSVNAGALIGGAGFAHGLTVEFEPVGVVNEAVEDGIGEGGFVDDGVPRIDGELAGDQG